MYFKEFAKAVMQAVKLDLLVKIVFRVLFSKQAKLKIKLTENFCQKIKLFFIEI